MTFFSDLIEDRKRLNRTAGVVLILTGILALLTVFSYDGADRPYFFESGPDTGETRNWLGRVGATLGEASLQLFGASTFLVWGLVLLFGWDRWRNPESSVLGRGLAAFAMVLSLAALLELFYGQISFRGSGALSAGGLIGSKLAGGLVSVLNRPGAGLLCAAVLAAAMILPARDSFKRSAALTAAWAATWWAEARKRFEGLFEKTRAAEPPRRTAIRRPNQAEAARAAEQPTPAAPAPARDRIAIAEDKPQSESGAPARTRPTIAVTTTSRPGAESPAAERKSPRQTSLPLDRGARGYVTPPLDLLAEPKAQSIESEQELLERAQLITEKLREFAVGGAVVAVHPGPVVTTFEFKPDAGVKYSKITGMTDDLSLALKAESVRIDRMAGRATVGIEVPNRQQETIYPRELIGSERFKSSSSKLTLALGKDITGAAFFAELDRMPHLLIAGATGAGKSVALNGMIVSLLYKATPEDLRFIMIDTKMIELGVYADIPHLLIPVVTDPKKAATSLKWAVREMEQRYRKLAAVGVRNLAQFNSLLEKEQRTMPDPKTGEEVALEHLPYIVIVIDEMADLMMVSTSEVEEAIMRLAQMARAVGIHLVLATQRPSVDVITGTIKANFPSRIAFRVSQRVDSRTIIDQQGAEHLLGRGDMLFLATGASRLVRLHGGYITESELARITSFLKKTSQPIYDDSVLQEGDEAQGGVDDGERDEMYHKAVETILNEGKCSITLIQRRLQLGYARAARIVDIMEREGVVSAGEGSKPREILVGPEFLESLGSGTQSSISSDR